MAIDNVANFVKVTVSTGYTSTNTSIILNGSYAMPTPAFNMTWWNSTDYPDPTDDPNVEIVRVTTATTVSGTTTLTVTRAQESTTASAKNTATKTYKMLAGITAKVLNTDILGTVWNQPHVVTTLTNGTNNNVPTNGQTVLILGGPSGAYTITGFAAPTFGGGFFLTVIDGSGHTITFNHQDAASTAANQIYIPNTTAFTTAHGLTVMMLIYDSFSGFWRLLPPAVT